MMERSVPADSPLRRQAADALRRARKLPVGPARNDLRQLAIGLRWLDDRGKVHDAAEAIAEWRNRQR
jgi:hypothetical protein